MNMMDSHFHGNDSKDVWINPSLFRRREQGLPRSDKSVLAMTDYCFMDMLLMLILW